MLYKNIDQTDCIKKEKLGLCTKDIEDIFETTFTEDVLKIINFSVPVLGNKEDKYKIFRFNGDLSILEKLKPAYRKYVFDETGYLRKEAVQIDSNDTIQIKIGNQYFTFIKKSDFHLLKNPYGETLKDGGEKGKIYRDTKSNFITGSFLYYFKLGEEDKYFNDFNKQILEKYIIEENGYNQIITSEYADYDQFYEILKEIPKLLIEQNLLNENLINEDEYLSFLAKETVKKSIKTYYDRTDSNSYKLNESHRKNIPLQLLVDLFQEIKAPGILIEQIQLIQEEENIIENSIVKKITDFIKNNSINDQNVIAKLLVLALSAHDPHTALEHSIEMANFIKDKLDDKEKQMVIFEQEISGNTKDNIILGLILHDIGKLFISNILLRKKGFTRKNIFKGYFEQVHIDKHTMFGEIILRKLGFDEIVIDMAKYHHPKPQDLEYDLKNKKDLLRRGYMYLCELVDIYNALRSERGYKLAHDNKKSLDIINKDTIPTVKLIDHIEYFVEKEITENYIKYIFRIKNPFIFVRNIGDTELNKLLKVNIGILHMNDNIFIFNDRNLSDFKNSLEGIDNYEQLIMIFENAMKNQNSTSVFSFIGNKISISSYFQDIIGTLNKENINAAIFRIEKLFLISKELFQ